MNKKIFCLLIKPMTRMLIFSYIRPFSSINTDKFSDKEIKIIIDGRDNGIYKPKVKSDKMNEDIIREKNDYDEIACNNNSFST